MSTKKRICQLNGDGIGAEVVPVAIQVLQRQYGDLEVRPAELGWQTFLQRGEAVPAETWEAIRQCGAALFGAVASPSRPVEGYRSAILQLRQRLQLRANVRPIDGRWGKQLRSDIRFVIVRENSEDLYCGRERKLELEKQAIAERLISADASWNIGRQAVHVGRAYGMNRITVVHKANVLPVTDGLFRDTVLAAIEAHGGPDEHWTADEMLVDVAALRLVEEPQRFQVIVTTNMFGDILSDLAAYWTGGLGRAPSINLGEAIAVAEPVHGAALDIAGQGIADPRAAVLSAALLCRFYWDDAQAADAIEAAVRQSIADSRCAAADGLCQLPSTAEIAERLIAYLETGDSLPPPAAPAFAARWP